MAIPTLEEILRIGKANGASDVHLTVGVPPKMRVNGRIITLDQYDRLMGPDTQKYVEDIMDERQFKKYDERGEFDMSFSIRELGRYRVNAFRQRGSAALAIRLVSTEVPDPVQLGVPESVIDLYQRKRGL
ncbi:MAG: type IV pili twitching motility protein PilT, partial [Lachnospiraceae bacterium]|nr:type IV pili twitching motility protein PilT [Lachnospiraceae bacterium]